LQIDDVGGLQLDSVARYQSIGVTAGASAPEVLVKAVVDRLVELGSEPPREQVGREEHVVFSLPRDLLRANASEAHAPVG